MTNFEIETELSRLVKDERRITNEILQLICLAEERKLFLQRGYSSLFDWLVHGFGYSHSAAYRRIQAARLLKLVPEVKQKLEDGTVNLTTLSRVQAAIRQHEKTAQHKMPAEEVGAVVSEIENKTVPEVELALLNRFPEIADNLFHEKTTQISDSVTRLTFNLDAEAMVDLEWAKSFLSHAVPGGEIGQVIGYLLREFRKRSEPKDSVVSVKVKGKEGTSATAANCVMKPAKARRIILAKAGHQCEFVDPLTGRRCTSTYQLQVDHVRPRALGGRDELSNYRCLCAAHNRFMAEKRLGKRRANRWRNRPDP